jgi:HlyD family secretion protein
MIRRLLLLAALSACIVFAGYGIGRALHATLDALARPGEREVPTTVVRRSDVEVTVPARGELQGGGFRPLIAPRTGAAELPITFLRGVGEWVDEGDVVVEFDPAGLQFELDQAEADLEEAREQLVRAEAEARVALEQARLSVITSRADLRMAELDQLDNPFVGSIQQRRNEIALERARNRHEQAVRDLAHRESARGAGLDVQRAAVQEAEARAATARRTIADLTLRAPIAGYVQLAENTVGMGLLFTGMIIPTFQVGDPARPGQQIARIPDMSRWEVSTQIPETDRAFLEPGQAALIRPTAMPGRELRGRVSLLGGSAGSAWNRTFAARIALDGEDEALRPGMSVDVRIHVETLPDVLWVPAQALFEREGRRYVYQRTPDGYLTQEVTLVRRTESQAVITGIDEGVEIALAEPGTPLETGRSDGLLGALPQ